MLFLRLELQQVDASRAELVSIALGPMRANLALGARAQALSDLGARTQQMLELRVRN